MALHNQQGLRHSTETTSVADLLERILDKGIVITGDIKIKLVDIELLSLEIRLVVCSVDKAVELGLDWWRNNASLQSATSQWQTNQLPTSQVEKADISALSADVQQSLQRIDERLLMLEKKNNNNK
ncbi:gas vesicle protein [Spartinivicinus ruber]|uniref:gas vesicle protein n=1 Tax=Spartinivicinus ruber TaxID=2683272 RepID=UPI0013D55768|nr:gas vesicle protein [Spartinivicinus ruber]